MKKTLMALAIVAMCGTAFATQDKNPCGNSGNNCQTGGTGGTGGSATGGTANAGAIAGAAAGAAVVGSGNSTNSNSATGGAATTGASTATVGNVAGGSATIAKDAVKNDNTNNIGTIGLGGVGKTFSPEANNTGNLNGNLNGSGNSSSTSIQGQQQGQGQLQGQAILGSGNSKNIVGVSTKGTVGNVSTGEQANAQNTTVGGQATTVSIVSGDNEFTVKAAEAAAAGANRGAEDAAATIAAATLAANATTEAAKTQAAALKYAADAKIKNTPSVDGPALTSSNDTCMGSTSGSVNAPGLGIGFGTSWVDGNCKMLKNSRELWNMGMKAAALALMCKDADNKAALEETGFVCPATAAATKKAEADAAAKTAAAQPEITDPIVRARLGLDPIVASK